MAGTLAHRGPDDQGVFVDGGVGLGSRRLAIIDTSDAGHQPLSNEEGDIWVAFNGEVYNFVELRTELEGKGHRFRSRTDTEVLVHLYEEEGPAFIERLRGMFALGLWDRGARRLLLARDRMGEKPLFYRFDGKVLHFASEIKAILEDTGPGDLDWLALHHYLAHRYVPCPRTIYAGIKELPPAHILVLEDDQIAISPYWQLEAMPSSDLSVTNDLIDELLEALRDAVRVRLVSDVPLGVFLSGGLDSSAVVAIMSGLMDTPVKTFAVGFDDDTEDLTRAARVAELFATDHHEIVVRPDAAELLPRLVQHLDEPFADPSIIPTYYMADFASQHVTVALNGDGADETFAGYSKYWQDRAARWLSKLPRPLRSGLLPATIAGLRGVAPGSSRFASMQEVVHGSSMDAAERYSYLSETMSAATRRDLYSRELMDAVGDPVDPLVDRYHRVCVDDPVNSILASDATGFLPDDLLYKMDMATMACSLEARAPFLDHKLVELSFSIPGSLKLKGLRRKFILKKALERVLPSAMLNLPKRGFDPPIADWLRRDLREMVFDLLLDSRARGRGYFQYSFVENTLEEHDRGQRDHGSLIWKLLILESWQRQAE